MAVNPQRLEKEGIYEEKSPVASLLSDLDQIGQLCKTVKARQTKQVKIGGLIILAGGIGVLASVVLPWLLIVSIPAMVCGLIWAMYSLFRKGKLFQHPKRLEIAKERLTMIQPDAKPEKPFALRLALASNPVQLSHEAWHGRKNGRQEFLEESWLSLEGPLLDGTVLIDEMKELSRKRTYSNARGKPKSKSRVTHLVSVRVCYPKERYGDARFAEQALKDAVKVGQGATLRSVRCSEKAIALKAMVTSDHDIAAAAGMLSLGAYRILNLARRMAKGKRGAGEGGKAQ